jgi:hypothetical protein
MTLVRRAVLAIALLGSPATAMAQVSPTAPAHPAFPWGIGVATPQGQLIRYLYVPPQTVTLDYLMTGVLDNTPPSSEETPTEGQPKTEGKPTEGQAPGTPTTETKPEEKTDSAPPPPQIVRQQVVIPGYYVRETTAGYHYPERWTVEQIGPNAYRWRQIPSQFVPK